MNDNTLAGDATPLTEQQIQMRMQLTAQTLNEIFNGAASIADRATGFVLLAFPFGEQLGRCKYISNVEDGGDPISMLKGLIAQLEEQPESADNG